MVTAAKMATPNELNLGDFVRTYANRHHHAFEGSETNYRIEIQQ